MHLRVTAERLTIELEGWERLLALKRRITLALGDVVSIETIPSGTRPRGYWGGVRIGSFVPTWIKAGTYYASRGREFWYVTGRRPVLELSLRAGPYRRVVVSPDSAPGWAQRIRDAATADRSRG